MPPGHCAFRALPQKVRSLDLCSADCTSLCKRRNRRDPSRRPCGHRGRCRRNAMGTQQQRASCAQKRKARSEKLEEKGEREGRKGRAKGKGERRKKSNGTAKVLLGRAGCASLW